MSSPGAGRYRPARQGGGRHCDWERPFRGLLGPHQSASRERSRGVRTTCKGTGAGWRRVEQGTTYSTLSVGTVSASPNLVVAEKPRFGGQGLYRFTPSNKTQSGTVFPSSLVPAGSPRDLSFLVISPAGTPQPLLWPASPALLPALCRQPAPGMGKGRVHELYPRNLVECMDLKTWWPPRQKRREEGTLLPFHGGICGCPAERGPFRGDPVQ